MSRHIASRRAGVAGLAVSLAAATALVTPAPAQAGVLDSPASAATVSVDNDGSCTVSGVAPTSAGTFLADGVPVQSAYSTTGTVSKPGDVTTFATSLTSTVKATQLGGVLKTVDVSASFQTSLSAALGTAQTCETEVAPNSTYTATLDLPTARYVTFDIDSRHALGTAQMLNSAGPLEGAAASITWGHGHSTQRVYLAAGNWQLAVQVGDRLGAPTPTVSSPPSRSSSIAVHLSLDEPGAALSTAAGDGSRYLDLGSGRTCAAGALAATWKAKAGKGDKIKVKKAVFRVNGAKVASVKKPKKGQTTTLTGLDPDRTAEVTVALKLVKKGAGKVVVERSYLPCT